MGGRRMGKILGIDLGVTSVGWGIIDDDYNVIDYGVRLHEEADAANNLKRRTKRGARRLKSRKTNRINAIKHLLKNEGIISNIIPLNNVYELRVKGLKEKLSNNELANVLVNLAKHRGSSLEVAVDEDYIEGQASQTALTNNTKYLHSNHLFVCEAQLEKIKKGEKLRDSDNVYHADDYVAELKQILANQGLSQEINEKIINIIKRRRLYSEGPGSEEFPTPYGSYRKVLVDGKEVVEKVNLIEIMRGKCSIFPDEPRIAKCSYTACLFNLLNDLNNISYDKDGEISKLTEEQKDYIITNFINKTGKITPTQLIKYLGVAKNQISGFRIDKNEKPLLTEFSALQKMLKDNINKEIILNRDKNDEIINVLTRTQIVSERNVELKALNLGLTDDEINLLANMTKINGYHSLSKKAMGIMLPELLKTNQNQMQIIENLKLKKQDFNEEREKEIKFDESAILSPVAKRVHMQAIKVINELRKEYGEFSSIIIETTRAKNSQDERDKIKALQKYNEEQKNKTNELILQTGEDPNKFNTLTKLKLRLYKEQNGKTMYAGLPIDINVLLNDPTAYQIEHIIPYAISFDNSLNNKCLASHKENQLKGRMTPFAYFASGKAIGPNDTFAKYEAFVESLNLDKNKKANLLKKDDVTKFSNLEEFTSRNLVDTSYGIRTVMNTLQRFFKNNDIDTKVFTIKGKQTHTFRTRVGLEKNRDEYIHHAIDALIIAGAAKQSIFKTMYEYNTQDEIMYSTNTGEVIDLNDDILENSQFLTFVKKLTNITPTPYDFSYKIDTKTNRQFFDETIYSTRKYNNEDHLIMKYKDIYGKEGESLKKLFADGKSEKLLMYRNDIATYNLFKQIYEEYKNEKNPFAKYKEEHGPIRKYAKDGNGPIITQVKYDGGILGNHFDISKFYDSKNKKVVLLQVSLYRTDIYMNDDGLYKFVSVRMYQIKQKNGYNYIDKHTYKRLLDKKGITSTYKFMFSLYKNNIINLVERKLYDENKSLSDNKQLYRFISTSDDDANTIEVKKITSKTEKRIRKTIGRGTMLLEKYNVSPIGKYQKVQKEVLKLNW